MADMKNNKRPPMGPGPGGPGHGPGGMRGPGGKPKDAKAAVKRIFSYIKNDIPMLVLVLVCVLTNTGCSLAGSYLLRPIINNLGDNAAAYVTARVSLLAFAPEDEVCDLADSILDMAHRRGAKNASHARVNNLKEE